MIEIVTGTVYENRYPCHCPPTPFLLYRHMKIPQMPPFLHRDVGDSFISPLKLWRWAGDQAWINYTTDAETLEFNDLQTILKEALLWRWYTGPFEYCKNCPNISGWENSRKESGAFKAALKNFTLSGKTIREYFETYLPAADKPKDSGYYDRVSFCSWRKAPYHWQGAIDTWIRKYCEHSELPTAKYPQSPRVSLIFLLYY